MSETINPVSVTQRPQMRRMAVTIMLVLLRTIAIIVLASLGFFVATLEGIRRGAGELVMREMGGFIGAFLVGTLIVYLITFRKRQLRQWIVPAGLALAIPLSLLLR